MPQAEPSELWDSFWAIHASKEDLFHNLLWRVRFIFSSAYARQIARYTGRPAAARLLEVGCGSARTLHYLELDYRTASGQSQAYALDLSAQAIKVVRQISPDFHSGVASAFELPIGADEIDVTFSIGLIEHFTREQARQMLREQLRVTRPGGSVGIVVPWQSSVYNLIVRKAFGKHWPFGDEDPFHRQELADFMSGLGLAQVRIHVIYGSTLLGIGRV